MGYLVTSFGEGLVMGAQVLVLEPFYFFLHVWSDGFVLNGTLSWSNIFQDSDGFSSYWMPNLRMFIDNSFFLVSEMGLAARVLLAGKLEFGNIPGAGRGGR